jgi:hypothetical protein
MENKSAFNWIIRSNFSGADFWLINKGSAKNLGKPVKTFEPYLTGIQCPAMILPEYGYYLCMHLHSFGTWERYANSSINLKHLRIFHIREVFNAIARNHSHQNRFITVDASLLVV